MEESNLKFVNYKPLRFSARKIYAILGDLNSENWTTLWEKGVFMFVLLFFCVCHFFIVLLVIGIYIFCFPIICTS